jgi:alpha-glucuronidase
VPAFGKVTIQVPVTAAQAPQVATLTAQVTAEGARVYGQPATEVLTAPRGDRVPLALDAGTPTSALLSTYKRLSPSDGWAQAKGYGWVGAAPQARDRGALDNLRRDIVTGTAPATLRVAVPAGNHDVYVLVGDASFAADAMTVSSEGRTLAHLATPSPTGEFRWLAFSVDGGAGGRTVDLDFAADNAGQYWRFAALAIA